MPDDYRRPNSPFWKDWEIVMMATKYTFSHYRNHCIRFTVNEELLAEASRAEKHRKKKETA